jgi:hypothetical protein
MVSLISPNVHGYQEADQLSLLVGTQPLGFALEFIQFHGLKLPPSADAGSIGERSASATPRQ